MIFNPTQLSKKLCGAIDFRLKNITCNISSASIVTMCYAKKPDMAVNPIREISNGQTNSFPVIYFQLIFIQNQSTAKALWRLVHILALNYHNMKMIFLLAFVVLQSLRLCAQQFDRITIPSGEYLSHYYTYRFPQFENATVMFKTGQSMTARVNFNMLLCTMEFVDTSGDTLEISKPGDIDYIKLTSCSFIYDKGYYEVISSFDSLMLLVSRKASFEGVKTGAMGTPAHGTSVDGYDVISTGSGLRQLQLSEDMFVNKKTMYLLAVKNGEMISATKSGFMKMFGSKKNDVETFLKSDKINFNKQNDLDKLFRFCTRQKA